MPASNSRQFKMVSAFSLRIDSGHPVAGATGLDLEDTELLAMAWEAAVHGRHTRTPQGPEHALRIPSSGTCSKGRKRGTLASSRATTRPCCARPTATNTAEAAARRKTEGDHSLLCERKQRGYRPSLDTWHHIIVEVSAPGSGRGVFPKGARENVIFSMVGVPSTLTDLHEGEASVVSAHGWDGWASCFCHCGPCCAG